MADNYVMDVSMPDFSCLELGGFYISNSPVTQREFEAAMRRNPSRVRNPAQPVDNVSIVDAMLYCNLISIRDGLEPAYIIERDINRRARAERGDLMTMSPRERELLSDTLITAISLDNFASGYRLATTDEWNYAQERIEGMGVLAEYVFDGKIEEMRVGARSYPAAKYMGHPPRSHITSIRLELGSEEYDRSNAFGAYEEILSELVGGGRRVRVSPVIRIVRPIFDYWKYTSGE
jgi:hypothetical protein